MSARNVVGARESNVPVSSVPPPAPTPGARGNAAARADSPLSLATPATTDGARTAAGPGSGGGNARSVKGKTGGGAGDATTSGTGANASVKQADSNASAQATAANTGANTSANTSADTSANTSAAGAPGATFGQTLSATLSATVAAATQSGSSAAPKGASTPRASSRATTTAAAISAGTTNGAASRGRSSDSNSPASTATATTENADDSADLASEALSAAFPGRSAHAGDAAPSGNTSCATSGGDAAFPSASAPSPTATPTVGSASDTAAASTAAAALDATARALPTPAQLLAQLNQAIGQSGTAGAVASGRSTSTDDAADDSAAQIGLTSASLDAAGQASESSHVSSPEAATQTLHSEVGSAAWSNELGARLTLMAQQGVGSASLRLSPPNLGPLEVRIAVRDNSATVWFGAQHSDTRAALEQALPRLREMFASQGLNLANAGVSGETPRGALRNAQTAPLPASDGAREVSAISVTTAPPTHQGLIDTYA
jgi:flagellar hook-length control protein FliK